MEIFELRYFLGAAETENLQKASMRLRVSPSSLSKAIARLESELGVSLFSREGRSIHLTDHGLLLRRQAAEIVAMEESSRTLISGHSGELYCAIAGPEVLLSEYGLRLTSRILKRQPRARFELHSCGDSEAVERVRDGRAHLALVTKAPPRQFVSQVIESTTFDTCVGPGHPLYERAGKRCTFPIAEILNHGFASPSHAFLGQVGIRQSSDGWRDDEFPRRVEYVASSLDLLGQLVMSGRAIAYLPDYWVKRLGARTLKISGCPYACKQKIYQVARDPSRAGWLQALFSSMTEE